MTPTDQSTLAATTPSPAPPPVLVTERRGQLGALARTPEVMTVALLLIAFGVCYALLPRFRDANYLFDRSSLYMETGVMAVAMTFVIIGGHIDLSCASILALVGAVTTDVYAKYGVNFGVMLALAPLLGALLGAVNGCVVAWLGLPSLVVTLATMAIYRGLAQVLIGDHSVAPPDWFTGIDRIFVGPTPIAMPAVIFVSLAVALGLVLHRTIAGRWVFAMGTSPQAALYSGVPVRLVTVGFFVLSGVLSALAGLMSVSRLHYARYDAANGLELDVITAVVLGGTNIFGGRGTMFGTVVALLLIAVLQTGMGLGNIKTEYQTTANGALLIFAVLASNGIARLRK
jgi:rhamnose transport system permease protein